MIVFNGVLLSIQGVLALLSVHLKHDPRPITANQTPDAVEQIGGFGGVSE